MERRAILSRPVAEGDEVVPGSKHPAELAVGQLEQHRRNRFLKLAEVGDRDEPFA